MTYCLGKQNNVLEFESEAGVIHIPAKYANLARIITRDLNDTQTSTPVFLYTKEQINSYLLHPMKNEKNLRDAVRYIYLASSHFRRLVQYFVGLSDLSYIVSPYRIDPKKANKKTVNNNYRKVLNTLELMNIKTQFPTILTVCLTDDTFYGTMWVTQDGITIQQLPSDYCAISSIEGNVLNVTFNFQYFTQKPKMLQFFPEEFQIKYDAYKRGEIKGKWIELDSPTSFAIKCNKEVLNYSIPPFAGLLREIYDIEDYKQLKLERTELENYAMLAMRLPLNDDGTWGIDLDKAKEFYRNLDAVLPQEIGSVLSPMGIDKISFERTKTGDTDTIAEAEQNLFTAAGVSSLLFNNDKASANALLLSIKADQAITYGIVKSIEDMVNRYIQSLSYGKNFKVSFLDVSPYNRKESGDAYMKAASYGLPTISMYAASQGLGQAQLDSMSYLEGEVLGLVNMFKPLRNSAQMSGSEDVDSNAATDEGGAPQKDIGDLTDSGEQSREDGDDW